MMAMLRIFSIGSGCCRADTRSASAAVGMFTTLYLHVGAFACAEQVRLARSGIWRRKRDSNPRGPSDPNGFQDRRLRPLGHSSIFNLTDFGMSRMIESEPRIKRRTHTKFPSRIR